MYEIEPSDIDDPEIEFDYASFSEAIQTKIANTFNEQKLALFNAMAQIVDFIAGKFSQSHKKTQESAYGVNTFAPVWEKMVDKIFGTISQDAKRNEYYPHLMYAEIQSGHESEEFYQDEDELFKSGERSALRPDTIMIRNASNQPEYFILDSKYYRYGLLDNDKRKSHLPGSESVCKQMAYAEHVVQKKNTNLVYNAFIFPYCADANLIKSPNSDINPLSFNMCKVGFVYGNWKILDKEKPFHRIECITLDMKSVMKNYSSSNIAQGQLANLIAPMNRKKIRRNIK